MKMKKLFKRLAVPFVFVSVLAGGFGGNQPTPPQPQIPVVDMSLHQDLMNQAIQQQQQTFANLEFNDQSEEIVSQFQEMQNMDAMDVDTSMDMNMDMSTNMNVWP
ncbi:hypothetical protein ACFYKX_11175 [Cytobacillus sp. FJAT-54145]|uniref:Uncharacterized protein n=1 Tax=Cytobacillus spartinae TaxID=3299023 RepID=A0ABW6KAG8_9BACI